MIELLEIQKDNPGAGGIGFRTFWRSFRQRRNFLSLNQIKFDRVNKIIWQKK